MRNHRQAKRQANNNSKKTFKPIPQKFGVNILQNALKKILLKKYESKAW